MILSFSYELFEKIYTIVFHRCFTFYFRLEKWVNCLKLYTKRLLVNKYIVTGIASFLVIAFVSWVFGSDILNLIFMDPNAPDMDGNGQAVKQSLIKGALNFDIYMTSYYYIAIGFIPVVSAFLNGNFLDEKNGYITFAYFRVARYKTYVRKRILNHALWASVIMFTAFLILFLVGLSFNTVVIDPKSGTGCRTAFSDLLGTGFSPAKLVLRFFLDGVLKCFIAPFVFSLITIAVSFLTDKKYLCVIAPLIYFLLGNSVLTPLNLGIFSPARTLGFISYTNLDTYCSVLPMILPLLFSLLVIEYGLRKSERLGY